MGANEDELRLERLGHEHYKLVAPCESEVFSLGIRTAVVKLAIRQYSRVMLNGHAMRVEVEDKAGVFHIEVFGLRTPADEKGE